MGPDVEQSTFSLCVHVLYEGGVGKGTSEMPEVTKDTY